MRQIIQFLARKGPALLLLCCLLPLPALATEAYIPEYGVSLRLPISLDVFTQHMEADNPVLALYGHTPESIRKKLAGSGLVMEAWDVAGQFLLGLSISNIQQQAIDQMTASQLSQLAPPWEAVSTRCFKPPRQAFCR